MLVWPPPAVCDLVFEGDVSTFGRGLDFEAADGVSAKTLAVVTGVRGAHHGSVCGECNFRLRWSTSGNGVFVRRVSSCVTTDMSGVGHFAVALLVSDMWKAICGLKGPLAPGVLERAVFGLRSYVQCCCGDVWPEAIPILSPVVGAIFSSLVCLNARDSISVCDYAALYSELSDSIRGQPVCALVRFGASWASYMQGKVCESAILRLGRHPYYCFEHEPSPFPFTSDDGAAAVAQALSDAAGASSVCGVAVGFSSKESLLALKGFSVKAFDFSELVARVGHAVDPISLSGACVLGLD